MILQTRSRTVVFDEFVCKVASVAFGFNMGCQWGAQTAQLGNFISPHLPHNWPQASISMRSLISCTPKAFGSQSSHGNGLRTHALTKCLVNQKKEKVTTNHYTASIADLPLFTMHSYWSTAFEASSDLLLITPLSLPFPLDGFGLVRKQTTSIAPFPG